MSPYLGDMKARKSEKVQRQRRKRGKEKNLTQSRQGAKRRRSEGKKKGKEKQI
jgi:hypothetical protein